MEHEYKAGTVFLKIWTFLALVLVAPRAEVIWYGDPDLGREIFNNLNFQSGNNGSGSGSIKPAVDPYYGKIWRVFKPKGDKRAEIRGATGFSYHEGKGGTMKENEVYYIGWRWKVSMPDTKIGDWPTFQWKSYPTLESTQNYPMHIKYDGRDLAFWTYDADWQKTRKGINMIWKKPVPRNKWFTLILVLKISRDPKVGYLEFYFDGEQQTFSNGNTRVYHKTMDGTEVAPKWGVYGGSVSSTEITVDLHDLLVGTTLQSATPRDPQTTSLDQTGANISSRPVRSVNLGLITGTSPSHYPDFITRFNLCGQRISQPVFGIAVNIPRNE